MVYQWKSGARIRADAQTAGEFCMKLANEGRLTAKDLLDESRPPEALLHDEFEWDDDVAAELYRKTQAGSIIRHLAVNTETKAPVRAFFNLEIRSNQFESIQAIIREEDKYSKLLKQALNELEAFQRKYQILTELQEIFDAITDVKQKTASCGSN